FIQLRLLRREVARRLLRAQAEVGWADGLVGLLRVLGLALVSAGLVRHIGLAEVFRDDRARACNRLAAQRHAVRTHVGDEAGGLAADGDALIQLLGDAHGLRGREAQLARGLLLERRGNEWRIRIAADRLLLDRFDVE